MSLDIGIYGLLHGDATIAGLVGTRIYPTQLPEGCGWPAILYTRPETSRQATFDTAGIVKLTLRVGCYGKTVIEVKSLADAVMNKLADFRGLADDVKILDCMFLDSQDGWDYEKSELGIYWRELNFQIFHR